MTVVICRSTRGGVGCGHPVEDHKGDQTNPCCCCNWKHNEPTHWHGCFRCQVRDAKAQLGLTLDDKISAGDLAPHLPENVRSAFWDDALGRYFEQATP